jgi:predicted nucleic acid-binding protein
VRVLPDTCVWSLALRRQDSASAHAEELRRLVEDAQVGLIGPIRQEILSGVRRIEQAEALADQLRAFVDLPLEPDDYERAASYFNLSRLRGIQGSNTDFLICAAAVRFELAIFTVDEDFECFASFLPITLHRYTPA